MSASQRPQAIVGQTHSWSWCLTCVRFFHMPQSAYTQFTNTLELVRRRQIAGIAKRRRQTAPNDAWFTSPTPARRNCRVSSRTWIESVPVCRDLEQSEQ